MDLNYATSLLTVLCAMLVFVVAAILVVYIQPHWLIRLLGKVFPRVLFCVDIKRKVMALTIDDAPSVYTEEVLDLLKQYNVKATFFIIGCQVVGKDLPYRGRELLERMLEQGHEIANHTWYDRPSIQLPPEELAYEVDKLDELLFGPPSGKNLAAAPPGKFSLSSSPPAPLKWFRPGCGWFNTKMLDIVEKRGYRTALGSVFPFDPTIPSAFISSWYVRLRCHPGGIIILHDRRDCLADTLRWSIPTLLNNGYQLVTLSSLVEAS